MNRLLSHEVTEHVGNTEYHFRAHDSQSKRRDDDMLSCIKSDR